MEKTHFYTDEATGSQAENKKNSFTLQSDTQTYFELKNACTMNIEILDRFKSEVLRIVNAPWFVFHPQIQPMKLETGE